MFFQKHQTKFPNCVQCRKSEETHQFHDFLGVESGKNYKNAPLSAYTPNDQWHLQMPLRYYIKNTPPSKTHSARFARLELEIEIIRDPTFYFTILITPIFIIYFLSGFVFLLPVDIGEKMSYSTANLLSQVVTLGTIGTSIIPESSTHFPILGKFIVVTIAQMAASTIVSMIG